MSFKKIVCIDFDGVVHSYDRGWQNGEIYGDVVAGFFEWVDRVGDHLDLVIYSSRSKDPQGRANMAGWLNQQFNKWRSEDDRRSSVPARQFKFADEKPSAWITIDDRAVRFGGNWGAPELSLEAIENFKPWNKA